MLLRILALWLFLCYSYSKADCLPDVTGKNYTGLCTPGLTITEEEDVVITEENTGTEIITTTTTTTTTNTTTVTNEDSGNILDSSLRVIFPLQRLGYRLCIYISFPPPRS